MRSLLLVFTICISLLVAGSAQAANVWALYDNDGFTARLGTEVGSNIEIGIEEKAYMDWTYPFQKANYLGGLYGIIKPASDITPEMTSRQALEPDLLTPYIGGRILFDYEDSELPAVGGPVVGVLICDIVTFEYQYQEWADRLKKLKPDRHNLTVGLKLRF